MIHSRRQAIVTEVERSTFLTTVEIAHGWGISAVTARRDIHALAEAGLLNKVRGGARSVSTVSGSSECHPPSAGEDAIVREALSLIGPGMTVGVAAGHMAETTAKGLNHIGGITVVTNSLAAAARIDREGGSPELLLLPGILGFERSLIGPPFAAALRGVNIDICFVSVSGFDVTAAAFSTSFGGSETARGFVDSSRRSIALAPWSRWGSMSLLPISADLFDTIITDEHPQSRAREDLASVAGPAVIAVWPTNDHLNTS